MMAKEVAIGPRPDMVRDLRDVLVAHQATLLTPSGGLPAPDGTQQAESLARDIVALMQSEIDTQVEWRVQQAVERLRAEGLGRPSPQVLDPQSRHEATGRIAITMVFGIPIIAIAGGIAGPLGLILALVALVMINVTWATGWVPGQPWRR
jgi:hypothetical protein